MKEALIEDIAFIIDYYFRTEAKKYDKLPDEKKKKHIFNVLKRVRKQLGKAPEREEV